MGTRFQFAVERNCNMSIYEKLVNPRNDVLHRPFLRVPSSFFPLLLLSQKPSLRQIKYETRDSCAFSCASIDEKWKFSEGRLGFWWAQRAQKGVTREHGGQGDAEKRHSSGNGRNFGNYSGRKKEEERGKWLFCSHIDCASLEGDTESLEIEFRGIAPIKPCSQFQNMHFSAPHRTN